MIPFNRPNQINHVLNMWKHQEVKVPLVLIANERDKWSEIAEEAGAIVILGQKSIGGARNRAVEYAKENDIEFVIFSDDDNYIGKKYVSQFIDNISEDVDVLSQGIAFVRFDDNNLYLFNTPLHFAPGHCTAFRVSRSSMFPEVNISEDVIWSKRMKESGAVFKQLPPWHSIYNRQGDDHAYKADKAIFMRSFGESKVIGQVPDSFVDKVCDVSGYQGITAKDEEIFQSLEKLSLFELNSVSDFSEYALPDRQIFQSLDAISSLAMLIGAKND